MVLLTTTPQILSVLSSLPPSTLSTLFTATTPSPSTSTISTSPNQDDEPRLPTSTTSPISHKTLIALSRLRRHHKDKPNPIPPLNTLLRGTKPYRPPPPPKPVPTPEYTALMTRLRLEQEQRNYEALMNQTRNNTAAGAKPAYEDEDTISPSLVFNVLLSVVMCSVAVFVVTRWWASDAVRVLLSLAAGLVIGVAEVGVYSIYLVKVRTAREKERAKKERKILIGPVLDVDEAEGVSVGGERDGKEEEKIWGRGVNGGVRRRVREKWEREQEKTKT